MVGSNTPPLVWSIEILMNIKNSHEGGVCGISAYKDANRILALIISLVVFDIVLKYSCI
tara:strand:+ start:430 stop:606 length:177 start_codon:yes stop_codon:yes gene_type:complete